MEKIIIREVLMDAVESVPSETFNEKVLTKVPAIYSKRKHFLSFDMPLIFVLFFLATLVLCLVFVFPALHINKKAVVLIVSGIAMLILDIMFFDMITSRRYKLITSRFKEDGSLA